MKEVKATVVNQLVELSKVMGMEISRKQAKKNAYKVIGLLESTIRDINVDKNNRITQQQRLLRQLNDELFPQSIPNTAFQGSDARIFIVDGATVICTPSLARCIRTSDEN